MQLKIVLCPVDFSDLAKRELALAVEVCETFGARLVLHHNLALISPGLTRAWEWNAVHRAEQTSSVDAEARMRELLAELPKTVCAEASISAGPLGPALLEIAARLPADLIVLGSHGWSSADHASVSERIIDHSPCPVLTIQEGKEVTQRFRLRAPDGEMTTVVVPTDLSECARRAVEYAFDLARTTPIAIHLLRILPSGSASAADDAAQHELSGLVPADLVGKTTCHVSQGDPIKEILRFSHQIDAGFIVMGEHARSFFRRFLTKDTAREVLHRAPCPVWFIPPER
jgi:nucleotide-binding universal stress UspA family protein